MSMLEQITRDFPVRKTEDQKEAFRKWLVSHLRQNGWRAKVEESNKRGQQNVVVGNPSTAEAVFTAHYDTAATIGVPDVQIPRNFPVYALVQAGIIIAMLLLSFAAAFAVGLISGNYTAMLLTFFGVYMVLLLVQLYGPANKNNVNDNTSGLAVLLEMMAEMPKEDREKVAFIFFDNKEKGCRGSHAYAKDHLEVQHMRLVVNLDCVGVGEHMLVTVPRLARQQEQYQLLEKTLAAQEGRTVHFFGAFSTRGLSDFRSFKCGVGISAHRQVSGIGFYTGALHTARDTQADAGNIAFLRDALTAYVAQLPGREEDQEEPETQDAAPATAENAE